MLALGGFSLSFSSLRDLALASGVYVNLAFVWPLIVDGFIVVSTASAFALKSRGRRVTWYPWAAIVLFSAISVAGNALHAFGASNLRVPVAVAATVSAVPAIALLVASHLLVLMIGGKPRSTSSHSVRDRVTRVSGSDSLARPTSPIALRVVGVDDVDLLPKISELLERGHSVTGATVARLANVSERTGRRRLESLRRAHPNVFEPDAERAGTR
jgi:hypothetical protein